MSPQYPAARAGAAARSPSAPLRVPPTAAAARARALRPLWPGATRLAQTGVAALLLSCFAQVAAADDGGKRVLTPPANALSLRGRVLRPDSSEWLAGIAIVFRRTEAQQRELDALLAAQRDPRSPEYRRWLTPRGFGQRFGAAPAVINETTAWLQRDGLQVDWVDPAGGYLLVSGSVATVEHAFSTALGKIDPNDGARAAFANLGPIQVPERLAEAIATTHGLSGTVVRPAHVGRQVATQANPAFAPAQPEFTAGGQHFIAPSDLHTIYNYQPLFASAHGRGAGVRIAVIGQSEVRDGDLDAFRRAAALPPAAITRVLVPSTGAAVLKAGDEMESDLDLEWTGASAPDASIYFVYVGNSGASNVFTALQYAISTNVAPIIALSYGVCDPQAGASFAQSLRATIQQASAQGQTVLSASGDSGVAACDKQGSLAATTGVSVNVPADIPEVTAVGGTEFYSNSGDWNASNNQAGGSATGYMPEAAWNFYVAPNSNAPGSSSIMVMATGGGASALFAKPVWQAGQGVPADGRRDLPDVSINSDVSYLICSSDGTDKPCTNGFATAQGQLSIIGGTSVSAPIWAGIIGDVESFGGGSRLGNINPALYGLLNDATAYARAFHDVALGDNSVPCVVVLSNGCPLSLFYQGYRATSGYDAVTGIGSPNVYELASLLLKSGTGTPPAPALAPTPTSSTPPPAQPASSGGGAADPLALAGWMVLVAMRRRSRGSPVVAARS